MSPSSLTFEQQSYRGRYRLPNPETIVDGDNGIFLLASSWGSRDVAQKILNECHEYLKASQSDTEVTFPYPIIPHLGQQLNSIRNCFLLANDRVYRGENAEIYSEGIELTIVTQKEKQISIGSVGQPSVFYRRENQTIGPLIQQQGADLNGVPLPADLVGLYTDCYPKLTSIRCHEKSELYFMSSSNYQLALTSLWSDFKSCQDQIKKLCVYTDPDPLWVGHLRL